MVTIGVVGGVASGKSEVARGFERLGCSRLDADRIGHEVLEDQQIRQALRAHWGEVVFAADGRVNRAAVAERVFATGETGSEELRFLERLTHPRIRQRLAAQLEQWRRQSDVPGAVLDAAVMIEAGWDRLCEHIVFVEVPRDLRRRRALARGWNEQQFADREAAQLPLLEKRRRAHSIIDNSGTLEETFQQVRSLWDLLSRPASRTHPI